MMVTDGATQKQKSLPIVQVGAPLPICHVVAGSLAQWTSQRLGLGPLAQEVAHFACCCGLIDAKEIPHVSHYQS